MYPSETSFHLLNQELGIDVGRKNLFVILRELIPLVGIGSNRGRFCDLCLL